MAKLTKHQTEHLVSARLDIQEALNDLMPDGEESQLNVKVVKHLRGASARLAILMGADRHGNFKAQEGCDRCVCHCKYWENDVCVSCGAAWTPEARDW